MIRIMGTYQGQIEEIDTAETMKEARALVKEYRVAFGSAWQITIKRGAK